MRYALLLVAVLLAIDALTKLLLPNESAAGGHQLAGNPPAWSLLIAALAVAWPITRLPAAVTLAGLLGNQLWTLRPGGVPNPFVHGEAAYNVADVCIVLGGYATALLIVYSAVVTWKRVVA